MKCVYLHLKNNVVKYVGSGNSERPYVTSAKKRSKEWSVVFSDCKPDVIIVKENLTENEALDLEAELIEKYKDSIVNKADPLKTTKELPLSEMKEYFEISNTSPSGLLYRKDRPSCKVKAGDIAGSVLTKESGKQYWQIRFNLKVYKVHRIVYALMTNKSSFGIINHIDNNGLNNSAENLEESNVKVNSHNKSKSSNNKSGIPNVIDTGKKYIYSKMINGIYHTKSISYVDTGKEKALALILEYKDKIDKILDEYLSNNGTVNE